MKFAIINPYRQRVSIISSPSLLHAQRVAGLSGVDHGMIYRDKDGRGLAAVVYEFGLCRRDRRTGEPIKPRPMFGYYRTLYAGNCVLYSFGADGETEDIVPSRKIIARDVIWLPTAEEAVKAITCGLVRRPVHALNGKVLAAWPDL